MEHTSVPLLSAKALLAVVAISAFFAIFATIDTSEHYRAWRTARGWSSEQKLVAPAQDAGAMHAIILVALVLDTAVIALAFAGGLILGVSVATEGAATARLARGLTGATLAVGLAYSLLMVAYQIKVGPRVVLKGPIFDYDLRMQVPIVLAVLGFPLLLMVCGAFLIRRARRS